MNRGDLIVLWATRLVLAVGIGWAVYGLVVLL